jgi:hypothetical protein
MSGDRYFAESVEHFNERTGEWSEQWLVGDDQRWGIDAGSLEWLFEIKCVNKDHALRVAQALNNILDPTKSGSEIMTVSQEDARELASDLRPSRLFK